MYVWKEVPKRTENIKKMLPCWAWSSAKACQPCRSPKMLNNEGSFADISFDTTISGPCKVWATCLHPDPSPPSLGQINSPANVRRSHLEVLRWSSRQWRTLFRRDQRLYEFRCRSMRNGWEVQRGNIIRPASVEVTLCLIQFFRSRTACRREPLNHLCLV